MKIQIRLYILSIKTDHSCVDYTYIDGLDNDGYHSLDYTIMCNKIFSQSKATVNKEMLPNIKATDPSKVVIIVNEL